MIRLIEMLNKKYNKTIIMISNDLNFLISFVDNYYIFEDYHLTQVLKKQDIFNQNLPSFINKSSIIEIIRIARKKGIQLENEYEINELIKEVFRNV